MRNLILGTAFLALGSLTGTAQTPTPQLLRDVSTGVLSPNPPVFVPFGDRVLLLANDATHGSELWITDGTTAGTHLVFDVVPGIGGSGIEEVVVAGDRAFFTPNHPTYFRELWVTDGTTAGTNLVVDLYPGNQSVPQHLTAIGNRVFYRARDPMTNQTTLAVSDGTAAGTYTLMLNALGVSWILGNEIVPLGDKVVFTAGSTFGTEPWCSDGTQAGTMLLRDIDPGPGSSSPFGLTTTGSRVFFAATDQPGHPTSTGGELWVTDGTPGGTNLAADVRPGPASSSPKDITAVGDRVFFTTALATSQGIELWVSDGTQAGTNVVDLVPGGSSSSPRDMMAFGDRCMFVATTPATGEELWTTDGTLAGTTVVRDIVPGPGSSSIGLDMAVEGERAFFICSDGNTGFEIWSSDGTTAGTQLHADLTPGPGNGGVRGFARPFAAGLLFFRSQVGIGTQLWIDPTPGRRALRSTSPCGPPHAQLAVGPPRIGQALTFTGRRAPTTPAAWLGLDFGPNPIVPLPTPLFQPQCHTQLGVTTNLLGIGAVTADWQFAVGIPNDPTLDGLALEAQALFFDGSGIQLSNGLQLVLGL